MADEKNLGFKVSDHRKFNPDGSLREPATEDQVPDTPPPAAAPLPPEHHEESERPEQGRVISFPGEAGRRKEAPDEFPQSVSPADSQSPAAGEKPVASPNAAFDELVNMLTVEALMHLGMIESPMGGGVTVDVESARHMIDMLGMLHEKTVGNLTFDESQLITSVLTDLRMQFVAISRGR
jgi:hypothetical protein